MWQRYGLEAVLWSRLECKASPHQTRALCTAYFLYPPEENESQWRDFCAALNREDCPEDRGFFLVTLISCGHLSQVRLDLSRGTAAAPGIWVTVSRFFVQLTAAPTGWWVHLSFHCLTFLGVSSVRVRHFKVPEAGSLQFCWAPYWWEEGSCPSTLEKLKAEAGNTQRLQLICYLDYYRFPPPKALGSLRKNWPIPRH